MEHAHRIAARLCDSSEAGDIQLGATGIGHPVERYSRGA